MSMLLLSHIPGLGVPVPHPDCDCEQCMEARSRDRDDAFRKATRAELAVRSLRPDGIVSTLADYQQRVAERALALKRHNLVSGKQTFYLPGLTADCVCNACCYQRRRPLNGQELQNLLPQAQANALGPFVDPDDFAYQQIDPRAVAAAQSLIDGTEGASAIDWNAAGRALTDKERRSITEAVFKRLMTPKAMLATENATDNGASVGSGDVPKRREPTESEKKATQAMDRAISRATSPALSSKRIGSWHQPWVP